MKTSAIAVFGLLLLPVSGRSVEGINDAQIASIVVTANQVDIDAGKLAESRATNPEVKNFDKAYVDREVAYHQQVIDAIDKVLIPGATNEELKALLIKVRPAFVAHLEHAQRLQSSLGK